MKQYKVLWFDDQHETLETIKDDAKLNDIILIGYTNAEDGLKELELNLQFYDAVVVDGKFYKSSRQSGDAVDDTALFNVARFFDKTEDRKKTPWFILSGQPSFIRDANHIAVEYKANKVYNKNFDKDFEQLWSAIKIEADKQPDTQIRHKYQNVFEICNEKYLGEETAKTLLYLIRTVEVRNDNQNTEEKLNAIRKILEKLFTAFNRIGVLPVEVLKGKGAINNSGKFLSGVHPAYDYTGEILHPAISFLLKNILNITQDGSHGDGDLNIKSDQFIKSQPTGYLFNSVIYQLLEILVWFKGYVDANNNIEKNRFLASLKSSESSVNFEGIIEQDSKRNFHCGEYLLNYNFILANNKIGDRIKIIEASPNTQNNSSRLYAKFATKFIKL